MKVLQSTSRNVQGCTVELEPVAPARLMAQKLRVGSLVVTDSVRRPIRSVTDRDLASAAFTQAVALYDSCIRCARLASEPSPEPPRAA
jgi:hypothetical protein